MNYDSIIIEMLARIQALEEQVKVLSEGVHTGVPDGKADNKEAKERISTAAIREYIDRLKCEARERGQEFLTIKANDIHKALKMKSRMSMVCNAMRQCMEEEDEVLQIGRASCRERVSLEV